MMRAIRVPAIVSLVMLALVVAACGSNGSSERTTETLDPQMTAAALVTAAPATTAPTAHAATNGGAAASSTSSASAVTSTSLATTNSSAAPAAAAPTSGGMPDLATVPGANAKSKSADGTLTVQVIGNCVSSNGCHLASNGFNNADHTVGHSYKTQAWVAATGQSITVGLDGTAPPDGTTPAWKWHGTDATGKMVPAGVIVFKVTDTVRNQSAVFQVQLNYQ